MIDLQAEVSAWDSGPQPFARVREASADLLAEFGATRLEETAFPVYTNRLPLARWLAEERVRAARMLAQRVGPVGMAVDFGAGLGVLLPYLLERSTRVIAIDRDPTVTHFMVRRMGLENVVVQSDLGNVAGIDLLAAMDVFEHVPDLAGLVESLASKTSVGGAWIISGPSENRTYRAMRRLSRTSGEGHVRSVDRVFEVASTRLVLESSITLPFGAPDSLCLFKVGLFRRHAAA